MPNLKLKIISGSEPGQNDSYSFSHLGGSIGRSEDCDWTLLDSDRFVSKKHLVIAFKNQQFILTDVSSNGVIVNSSGKPLGRGNEHTLKATDTLVIGKHIVKVEEINLDVQESNPFQSQQADGDLFGLVMGDNDTPKTLQDTPPSQAIPDNAITPDFYQDIKPQSDLGLGDILSAPVKSSADKEFSNASEQSNPFNIQSAPITHAPNPFESQTTNTSSDSADILIPDDWEMFDTKSTKSNFEPAIPPHSPESKVTFEEHQIPKPQDDISVQADTHKNIPDFSPAPNLSKIDEQPLVSPAPQPASQKVSENINKETPPESISPTTTDDFFGLLYEKLGLANEFKDRVNREEFAEDIASILLSTTQGLMSLLASRTAFKQESRMSATLIQPKSNNPIKFSIDPVDTLEMLLVKKKKGYKSVEDSYQEAMEDIQLHQMAFMSGLQGTLDGVLAQLNPEDIEAQANEKSQIFKGLNTNSQCWKIYKEKQPLLAKSVKENLNEVLGTYFSDAYQSHINRYKSEK